MSRILNGTHRHREHALVSDSNLCRRLVQILCEEILSSTVHLPVLRTLVNIASGAGLYPFLFEISIEELLLTKNINLEKQTQAVIDAGALTVLTSSFLTIKNLTLRRDACLAVSNVAAGTYKQVNAVLTEPNLMKNVVALLWDSDMKVVKEACWVLSNSTSLHDPGHIHIILQHDIISPLVHHLRNSSTPHEILNKILDTLVNILSVGDLSGADSSSESHNEYARMLAASGVVNALIETWNNMGVTENIKEKVRGLLERWFYDYLPRDEHSGEVGDDGIDISSIEESVSRMSIMEGVD
ncbi:5977_t:CDS:2, partial [Acaulospora morrowiae]